ncbi:MAG TPA: hypothetical protein ENI64_04260 [Gammaproteobacteria bacterium]|nr:hypothetical protein [Gammaproteobacteria bacterium]
MEHKKTPQSENQIPIVQQVISVLWPSFLTAGIATIFTFTFFDPQEIVLCTGHEAQINRLGIYSLGFFLFWVLTSSSCALTCYFRRPVRPH